MIVEVLSAMLFVSVHTGGEMGAKMVEETKVLLRRYLAPIARDPKLRASRKKNS